MTRFCITLLFLLFTSILFGQITVDNSVTPEDAVQELLGDNITISNFEFTGFDEQIGYFDCVDCGFDFTSGVILGTGDVVGAVGPNDQGAMSEGGEFNAMADEDLADISWIDDFHDIAAMEFDFVALGDSITFNYTYASEEYHTFISAEGIHDVFMLLISGPGINGPYSNNSENIALIPGTTQGVTNATINNGNDGESGPCVNCEYFVFNGTGNAFEPDEQFTDETVVQYNGYTTGLSAVKGNLQCGETYHLRIVIGDASDNGYDSAVIIESNSISSNLSVQVEFNVSVDGYGEGLAEGCGEGELLFIRPPGVPLDIPLDIDVTYGGTATYGSDYNELPSQIHFDPGVAELLFLVEAFVDVETGELPETVQINVEGTSGCTGGTAVSTYEFEIIEIPELTVDLIDQAQLCLGDTTLIPVVEGGFGDYTHSWVDQFGTDLADVNELYYALNEGEEITLNYTVSDVCDNIVVSLVDLSRLEALVLTMPDFLTGDCITLFEIDAVTNLDADLIDFNWTGTMTDYLGSATNSTSYIGSESGIIDLIADAGCGNIATAQTEIFIATPVVELTASADSVICLFGSAFLTAEASGGSGDITYEWVGNDRFYSDQSINVSPTTSNVYTVTATDQCGTQVDETVFVSVDDVGATFNFLEISEDEYFFEPVLEEPCSDCTYFWEFTDGEESEEESPIHIFEESGYVGATLTVTTPATCESVYVELINVPAIVYIPNSFTPDNDGINDVWKVEISGIDQYELRVFNRWGEEVFFSRDPKEVWNGSVKNGDHYAPNGTYSYVLNYRALDTQAHSSRGTVTLLR